MAGSKFALAITAAEKRGLILKLRWTLDVRRPIRIRLGDKRSIMPKCMLAGLLLTVSLSTTVAAESPGADTVWGNDWMAGGYHQHDLQLSERVGLSLDWQGSRIDGMSLSYSYNSSSHFVEPTTLFGLAPEEPLTFRVTLRGWELFESNSEDGSDFFSFDRIRDRDIRRQLIMISVSKRF
jgi:hypothetical protein